VGLAIRLLAIVGDSGAVLIRDLTTDKIKRELFNRLHEHLNRLADEVEQALKTINGVRNAT
jgi:hypothetical protein